MNDNTPITTNEHLLEAIRRAGEIAGAPVTIGILASSLAKGGITTKATALEETAKKLRVQADADSQALLAQAADLEEQARNLRSGLAG